MEAENDEINRLQAEIKTIDALMVHTESEIQALIQSLQQDRPTSTELLPTEIFLLIMHSVISDTPSQIYSLMLVCRSWHRIILNNPISWTYIRVRVPSDYRKIDACAAYATMCVERSRPYPLHIHLDYSALENVNTPYVQDLAEAFENILSLLGRQLPRHSISLLRRGMSGILFRHYQRHCLKPLKSLVGENMTRWKSFDFVSCMLWRKQTLAKAAFATGVLLEPTPLLQKLRMKDAWRMRIAKDYHMRDFVRIFPLLSAVEELSLGNICASPRLGTIKPSKLKNLDFKIDSVSNAKFVSGCHGVEKLRLVFSEYLPIDQEFSFPQLVHLYVPHKIPPKVWEQLQAPLLRTISFESHTFQTIPDGVKIPSVTEVELTTLSFASTITALRPLIQGCPSITTIVCHRSDKEAVITALRQLDHEGIRALSLHTMDFLPERGRKLYEPISLRDIYGHAQAYVHSFK